MEKLTQDQASAALARDLAEAERLPQRRLLRRIAQLEAENRRLREELKLERMVNDGAQ